MSRAASFLQPKTVNNQTVHQLMNAQAQHSHDRTLFGQKGEMGDRQKMWVGLENVTFDAETKSPVQWHGSKDVEEEVVTLVKGVPCE